jgi:hypothetical protein
MALELVYVRSPKAGGTSLVQALKGHYDGAMAADYEHSPASDWSHDPPRPADGVRAVFGHFHAERYAACPSAFRFTLLREPAGNLISIFYFWRIYPPSGYPVHERFLREQPSILEFAAYPEMRWLVSRLYFGRVDLARLFVGFFDVERISQGFHNVSESGWTANFT